MLTGSQSKIVARDGSGFNKRHCTVSTRASSEGTEQSTAFGCTDSEENEYDRRPSSVSTRASSKGTEVSIAFGCTNSEMRCQSATLHDRRPSFNPQALTSLACDDTLADFQLDATDETDVLHTSPTTTPRRNAKEDLFKSLVCGDISAGDRRPSSASTRASSMGTEQSTAFGCTDSEMICQSAILYDRRPSSVSTRASSKGTEQSIALDCTDSEMRCQSATLYDRRPSFNPQALTSLVCDDTLVDFQFDATDETDVLHTSPTTTPRRNAKEDLFKSLVCGDTSADLDHYDTVDEFAGGLWPWLSCALEGFKDGFFLKSNLVYDDTSADLYLEDEELADTWTEDSVLLLAPQTAASCRTPKEALFAGLVCDDTSADLHYDTPAEFDGVLWLWASLATMEGTFSKRNLVNNLVFDNTSADLHLGGEEPMGIFGKGLLLPPRASKKERSLKDMWSMMIPVPTCTMKSPLAL